MCTWDPHLQCSWSNIYVDKAIDVSEGNTSINTFEKTLTERQEKLFQWIEDLLNSAELEQYFNRKLPKVDNETQCNMSEESISWEDVSIVEEISEDTKYPLTKLSKQKYQLLNKIECMIKNRNNMAILESQYQTIKNIRRRIAEEKMFLHCHPHERLIEAENKRLRAFEFVKKFVKNELKYLTHRNNLVDKVLAYQKLKRFQKLSRHKRRIEIVQKLLKEFRRLDQIYQEQHKTFDYKVQPSGFEMKGLEIVGAQATLFSREIPKDKEPVVKEIEQTQQPEEPKVKGKKKEKKDKGAKIKESDKSSKKKEKKKNKDKGKKGKGAKKKKEIPEEPLVDIEQVMTELKEILENSKELKEVRESFEKEKDRKDNVDYPKDKSFCWKPLSIDFKDYESGITYQQTLKILNCSSVARKFRYLKTLWDPPWDTPTLEIEPVGVQRVRPGLTVKVRIYFDPLKCDYLLTGSIYFLTYTPKSFYQVFAVPFRCIPLTPEVTISANEIHFETMPIWKAKERSKENFAKTVTLSNTGTKECFISITKIHDPLETEEKWKFLEDLDEEEEQEETIEAIDTKREKKGKKDAKGKKDKKKDKLKKGKKEKKQKKPKEKEKKKTKKDKKVKKSKKDKGKMSDKDKKKMETELEAQILQRLLEYYMPPPPVEEEQSLVVVESPSKDMMQIARECVENAFNSFVFEECCFPLPARSRKMINIFFRNIDYAGYYYEKFNIKIFEEINSNEFFCLGIRELTVHGEVTGNFIHVNPITLDYKICVMDSVYQLQFNVKNTSSLPHGLSVKLPSSIKKYLDTNGKDFYVPAGETRTLFLRFFPRIDIMSGRNRYFNFETNVIEFPILVSVVSKRFLDTPPVRVTVYAVLTQSNGLILQPEDDQYLYINENREYVLNLGDCSTKETVFANIKLTNTTLAVQHYGFLDLPESVTIFPNYGFGIILPLESNILTLMLSPQTKDIPNYFLEGEMSPGEIMFSISVDTIKSKGSIKETKKNLKIDNKFLRRSTELLEEELSNDPNKQLYNEIICCINQLNDSEIANKISSFDYFSDSTLDYKIVKKREDEDGISNESMTSFRQSAKSNKMWLISKVINPYCDLSHQFVRFPDTPCGSCSLSSIEIRYFVQQAFNGNCVCGYIQRNTKIKPFKCLIKFESAGDNPEINVEPFCGQLGPDKLVKKLYLVAKPEIPPEVVEEQAKAIKRQEIIDRKLEALLEKRQKEFEAKKLKYLKAQKNKKGKRKEKEKKEKKKDGKKGSESKSDTSEPQMPPLPPITVKDDEIKINFFDLYPAEMVLWRNFESYEIEGHFMFNVEYSCDHSERKTDTIYLDTVCKVIRPDFTHNLIQQRINFGQVLVGMSSRKTISIQNIQHISINPKLSLLNPIGPYTCPVPNNMKLEAEHILNIPILFAPIEAKQEIQYLDITAGRTSCTVILSGEGVDPNIRFIPDFLVCRLETPFGNHTEFNLEIENKGKAGATIRFVKTCELQGLIKEPEKIAEPKEKKQKGKKKEKKSKKGSKKGKGKTTKTSQQLSIEEMYSLENFFHPRNEDEISFFDVQSKDNLPDLDPNSKKSWKIRFGIIPKPTAEKPIKLGKKGKEKPKKEKKTKERKCSPAKSTTKDPTYYIAKFNIILGHSTVLRDIIVIAKFCK